MSSTAARYTDGAVTIERRLSRERVLGKEAVVGHERPVDAGAHVGPLRHVYVAVDEAGKQELARTQPHELDGPRLSRTSFERGRSAGCLRVALHRDDLAVGA